ncbi:unnamed protein product [Adineta ricciae]|uniref:Uncharacterized protein n=1 Tax=Adineta ricciae TaxID=249248 RepID=A0A814X0A0_ADIRI|nr:unnamed protein product [Adineta ricciae]CAF1456193.1 unnamed protein product [Adineta ricciae]
MLTTVTSTITTTGEKTTSKITTTATTTTQRRIKINRKWMQNGITIVGGKKPGIQLLTPRKVYIDDEDDQIIYIIDRHNNSIIKWKQDVNEGEIIAGGNGAGDSMNQLDLPSALIIDKHTDSYVICDWRNKRVVRWFKQNHDEAHQQIVLSEIDCSDLSVDSEENFYLADYKNLEIKRWRKEEAPATIVASGNALGDQSNQVHLLLNFFVDRNQSIYLSDAYNHRVLKWAKGTSEATVVAGGHGEGDSLTQLRTPSDIIVDQQGNIYIADQWNHRIMCWLKGSKEGSVIVGGKGEGEQSNQLNRPSSLSFDQQGNLYVADYANRRIQKFDVID